ncbi:unnamed protein product [Psylliodes chrysocephalus]|uniref:chitin synthase n=1 Tax=Psylliodes chrysocephalus TaxID=3402493 RepID=A0A9P0CT48_9CUCU|nr:unnamed protein product [Psylliodes chrysocephala]
MTRDRYEEEPLIDNEMYEEKYNWNLFKNTPRETVSGSLEQSKYIDGSIKFLKITTIIVTFLVVLLTAVISKGSLLFMTSQIRPNITRLYCNKYLDNRQQYIVNHPVEERTVWIWLIIFSYLVPEMGTLFRSLRIVCFKSWKYPTTFEFIILALTEILPTIGSCLLVFIVFPELDVIKAAMLTNGICLVPGVVAFISRKPSKVRHTLSLTLDIAAIAMQVTALLAWPIVEQKPILYVIPVSLCLISIGWWENFASEKSIFPWIGKLAKDKKEFKNDFYFMYAIITPIKCLIFFVTVLVITWTREGDVTFMFDRFWDAFNDHSYNVTQIEPIVGTSHVNYTDAVSSITSITMETSFWTPLLVFLLNIGTTYMCYAFSKFACKIMIQSLSLALPITLTVPVLLTALVSICGMYNESECAYADSIPMYLFWETPPLTYLEDFVGHQHAWIWLVWLLSQSWITIHIWANDHDKLMSTEKLFFKPMYDAFLIDQSVAMNRRREQLSFIKLVDAHDPEDLNMDKDKVTKIYACGTMWHETKEEMVEFLKSVLRLDEDQCAHRIVREYLQYNMPNYYEFENSVSEAASNVHEINVKIKPPIIYSTPYGGRLVWTLPGRTKMIAHLKDKAKIRPKKRWSQVMYMYYLLGYRIMDNDQNTAGMIKNMAKNTYILALDGDIDFQPEAVHLLVDYMKKNQGLGAACGRIHPVGSGAMAWYQIFEYAVGHWLQKATEHVIGCVLCSPGCFSLFRAGALMDDNVMAKYTTEASEARHYVQYDQGTVIGPGTIFLMLVGAFVAAFKISQYYSMVMNTAPVLLFIIICATCKSDTQLFFAGLISAVYGLVMMTVFVGIMIQIEQDGWMAPSSLFLIATAAEFVISAIMHPQEFYCLKYGIIYYVTVPSMYMLLVIYSIFNMNNVSWGTREVTVVVKPKENKDDKGKPAPEAKPSPKPAQNGIMSFFGDKKDNTGSMEFSFGGLFKLMCCTYDGKGEEREILRNIHTSLQQDGASFRPSTINPNVPESESYADEFEDDEESNFTPSDDVDANSWFYQGALLYSEVQYLDRREKTFWEKFIQKYLYPLDETSKKHIVEKDLKDLRDKMVLTFFMLNALFVLVIFLLNLQQDIIHVNWPIAPKINFTFIEDVNEILIQETYLQLQPIGFVFLISFALLMGVQFIAMFLHRFGTFCQIMSNTDIDFNIFGGDDVENVTEETLLDKDPIKIFKKLIR